MALGLLLDAERPLGAYGLMERLRAATRRTRSPRPPSTGLWAPRWRGDSCTGLDRLDAFAIRSVVARGGGAHPHAHRFLICRGCGTALELRDASVARALSRAAARSGFAAAHAVVEVEGLYAGCAAAPPGQEAPATGAVPAA